MIRFAFLALALAALANQPVRAAELSGAIRVDGSSTVYPITSALAEEFGKGSDSKNVRVTVGNSGTGGGFKKWCLGETDINDASRPISEKEEACAKEHGITYLKIPVAYDGITVIVSQKNKFLKQITFAQLKKIWEPESTVKNWNDVDASWPKEAIKLFGPTTDHGTFDYFTEEVVGKARASRSDYLASKTEMIATGVQSTQFALGYEGYANFLESKGTLTAVPVDSGKGAVAPNAKTIENGTYPLSRQIFIYVSSKAATRPEVQAFVRFYLAKAPEIVQQVGYVALKAADYKKSLQAFEKLANAKAE